MTAFLGEPEISEELYFKNINLKEPQTLLCRVHSSNYNNQYCV